MSDPLPNSLEQVLELTGYWTNERSGCSPGSGRWQAIGAHLETLWRHEQRLRSEHQGRGSGLSGSERPRAIEDRFPLHVFLCHSSSDKPAVRELYRRLIEDGFAPWLDEQNLMPGQVWQEEITKAVSASDVVIVCLSQNTVNKEGYVQKEIRYVLDVTQEQPEGTVFVIPVKLEECDVPVRLRQFQWVNLFESSAYGKLTQALRSAALTRRVLSGRQTPQATRATSLPEKTSSESVPIASILSPQKLGGEGSLEVLFSYSHHDERLRNELDKHLALLKRQNLIRVWHDRKITPGKDFNHEILQHLETADLILLLISADFLTSEYCYTREMKIALQRHDNGKARVIPVILRPVDWQHGPFSHLLALPTDGKPVTTCGKRDAAFLNVATGIRRVVESLTQ